MSFFDTYENELKNPNTNYFILTTKGGGLHGDLDFVKYEWSPKRYNKVKEGDLAIFRRPGGTSETGKFYFFGAAKIGNIKSNVIRITGAAGNIGVLEKSYPFKNFLHPTDLIKYEWEWKKRGKSWEHFFNEYGMDKIASAGHYSIRITF